MQADVTLAPYDIIRLKNNLGISSSEFLNNYTVPFELDGHGVPGVKLRTTDAGACKLMTDEGCSVYQDRPTACRYYPVGLLSMKRKDAQADEHHYVLVKEDHCLGHLEPREISFDDYRKDQGVEDYDTLNREYYRIMLKKRSSGPAIGRPSELSLQLFFMVCYDIDRFRRFASSEAFKNNYALDDAEIDTFVDDVALLQFGYRLLKQVLFGENSIPVREGAIESRVEARRDVLQARKQAEIARWQSEEEKRKRET